MKWTEMPKWGLCPVEGREAGENNQLTHSDSHRLHASVSGLKHSAFWFNRFCAEKHHFYLNLKGHRSFFSLCTTLLIQPWNIWYNFSTNRFSHILFCRNWWENNCRYNNGQSGPNICRNTFTVRAVYQKPLTDCLILFFLSFSLSDSLFQPSSNEGANNLNVTNASLQPQTSDLSHYWLGIHTATSDVRKM